MNRSENPAVYPVEPKPRRKATPEHEEAWSDGPAKKKVKKTTRSTSRSKRQEQGAADATREESVDKSQSMLNSEREKSQSQLKTPNRKTKGKTPRKPVDKASSSTRHQSSKPEGPTGSDIDEALS